MVRCQSLRPSSAVTCAVCACWQIVLAAHQEHIQGIDPCRPACIGQIVKWPNVDDVKQLTDVELGRVAETETEALVV